MIQKTVINEHISPKSILHTGDIHFFLNKRHQEHRNVVSELCSLIKKENIDLVYLGGDIIDSKNKLSPEQIKEITYFFYAISELCPIIVIPGNHDTNLQNDDRLDSLSPILEQVNSIYPIYYLKHSGIYPIYNINWAVWSCIDSQINPFLSEPKKNFSEDAYFIGCYHGAINGCLADNGFILTNETNIDEFRDCNVVFLNDQHKRQYFRNDEMAYSGSILQTRMGEDEDKGVLIWRQTSDKIYKSEFHKLYNEYGFKTFEVIDLDKYKILDEQIPSKFIGQVVYVGDPLTFSANKFESLRKKLQDKHKIKISPKYAPKKLINKKKIDLTRATGISLEDHLRNYLRQLKVNKDFIEKIIELDRDFSKQIDQSTFYGGEYALHNIKIHNFMAFGSDNELDLQNLSGLIGLFAKNKFGKSTVLDAITFCLFGDISKPIKSFTQLVNDQINQDAFVEITLTATDGFDYRIRRSLLIKKDTIKSKLEVYQIELGSEIPKHEESRIETDSKVLRPLLGDKQTFLTTVLCSQKNPLEFSSNANTSRFEQLYAFLGLTPYETKWKACGEKIDNLEGNLSLKKKSLLPLEASLGNLISEYNDYSSIEEGVKSTSIIINKNIFIIEKDKVDVLEINNQLEKKIKTLKKEVADLPVVKTFKTKDQLEKEKTTLVISRSNLEKQLKDISFNLETQTAAWAGLGLDIAWQNWKYENTYEFLQLELYDKKNTLSQLQRQITDSVCPVCGKERDEDIDISKIKLEILETQNIIKNINDEVELKKKKLLFCQNLQNNLREHENQQNKYISSFDILVLKEQNIDKELQSLDQNQVLLKQKEQLEEKLDNLSKEYNKHKLDLSLYDNKIYELTKNLQSLDKQYGKLVLEQKNLQVLETEINLYTTYRNAIHRQAFPASILATYLPEINNEINNYLSDLFDVNVFFEINNKQLEINYFYEELEITHKRDIAQTSGMEGFVINLAIRAALTKISCLPKASLLMIDEGFSVLDEEYLEKVRELLLKFREQYNNIIIITHLEDLKDLPEHIIKLERENGITRFIKSI
jgi:DNA repair exonuclease SbcCD nuclease subunit